MLQSKMRQEDPSAHTEELGWLVQSCCSITKSLGNNWFCFPSSACLLRLEAHIYSVLHFTLKWEGKKNHTKDPKIKDLWFKHNFHISFITGTGNSLGLPASLSICVEKHSTPQKKTKHRDLWEKVTLQQGTSPGQPSIIIPKGCGAQK